MQPRSAALLWDAATAAGRIQGFVADKSWDDYNDDLLLWSGVERQFEIAGEAMNTLRHVDPETADRVPDLHKIVGMRNVLIHGYAHVNNLTVWRAATENLDEIVSAIDALQSEAERPGSVTSPFFAAVTGAVVSDTGDAGGEEVHGVPVEIAAGPAQLDR